MKNIFFILVFSIFTYSAIAQNAYSKGFKEGYKKGYCHNKGFGCVSPIAPVAPIPSVNESNNSYNDGYNRGFAIGLNQNKSSSEQSENNDNIYKGSTNGYPTSSNNGTIRKPITYNKPTSSINHELIAKVLRQKQDAIDKERAYFNSLSYEERQVLLKSRAYSKRKSNLYKKKNISRFYKADKKAKKEAKKPRKRT